MADAASGGLLNKTDVFWMKMALMGASWAEITEHAAGKPSVGCIICRSRDRGAPAVLAVGWNGFLPNTSERQLNTTKESTSEKPEKKRENILTGKLGLHAEANALQYCSEVPVMATVYVTHVPCKDCTKQLIARRVGRVYFIYWMEHSDSSIELFREFNITCMPFTSEKREEVLKEFSPTFLKTMELHAAALKRKGPQKTVLSLLTQETVSPSHRMPRHAPRPFTHHRLYRAKPSSQNFSLAKWEKG